MEIKGISPHTCLNINSSILIQSTKTVKKSVKHNIT